MKEGNTSKAIVKLTRFVIIIDFSSTPYGRKLEPSIIFLYFVRCRVNFCPFYADLVIYIISISYNNLHPNWKGVRDTATIIGRAVRLRIKN